MVAPKDIEKLRSLPQYGGEVDLVFESIEDMESQMKTHLPHACLFVQTDLLPKNVSEFFMHLSFPDNSQAGNFQARLIQCIELGPSRGVLLQIVDHLEELTDKVRNYLESRAESAPEPEDSPVQEVSRLTIQQELRGMTPTERAILASKADKHTRSVMIRDNEPHVIMFLLKNPRITRQEILEISKVKALNYQAIQIIVGNKQWIQYEEIRYNLVMNPKTPLQIVLKLLKTLNVKHIREIAKNHQMKTQIKQAALRIVLGQDT